MMKALFQLVGALISGAVTLGIAGYSIKYGFDAAKGEYCFPLDSKIKVLRHAAALGNDIVNLGAAALDKKLCPTYRVFRAPAKTEKQSLSQ